MTPLRLLCPGKRNVGRSQVGTGEPPFDYIKLADKRLGLLINFGARLIKHGITRVVNRLPEAAWSSPFAAWRLCARIVQ